MDANSITLANLQRVIERGVITEVALDNRSNRESRVEGNDQAGRHLVVVINRFESQSIKLITTFVRR